MRELSIASTSIWRDDAGRYCLNDLHRAAGEEARHRPAYWLAGAKTLELVAEVEKAGIPAIAARQGLGTFAAKELVYAYAMWISPAFHLQVIRAYDQLVAAAPAPDPPADPLRALSDPATLRGLLLTYSERVQVLEGEAHLAAPKVRALEQLADAVGAFTITEAAKMLQVRPRQLFAWLEQHAWIYRRAGGKNWLAYQPRLQSGALVHKAALVRDRDDVQHVHEQVLVTAKGLAKLGELICRDQMGWTVSDHLRAQQLRQTAGAHA